MSAQTKKAAGCQRCIQYDEQWKTGPHTLRLRFWKWHTGWCPGYKAHLKAVANQAKK